MMMMLYAPAALVDLHIALLEQQQPLALLQGMARREQCSFLATGTELLSRGLHQVGFAGNKG
jgi:hypothetical protein